MARPPGHGPSGMLAGVDRDDADRPARPPTRKLRKLLPYFRPYRGRALLTVALMFAVSATGLAGPALAQVAIDSGIRAGDRSVLVLVVALFVAFGLVGWAAGAAQSYLSSWVGERVLLDLRARVFSHLMGLELGYHERQATGRTVSRLTSDIEALDQLVTEGATTLVTNVLSLVGMVVIMFLYDWQLALIACTTIPLLLVATQAFRRVSTGAYRETRERIGNVLAFLQETISGIRVVQGFGRQHAASAEFDDVNRQYREANMRTVRVAGVYFPGVDFLATLGTAAILWFGAQRVLDGDLTVGVLVAFLGYLAAFFDPIQSLSQLFNTFQSAMAALEKILGVLETGPTLADAPDARVLPTVRGAITLDNVSFAYARTPVLSDVNLGIDAGQTIALVGETGAGKSTLAKLIARFYDTTSGRVLIDGHDVRDVTQTSLRSQLGIVPQEGYLFSGTVAENLRFARPSATDDDLLAACDAVGARAFVDGLPEGLETQIEERGARLSAGQRQLLCFARALVADPRILILDEATSSVDLRSERIIERAMRTLLAGRTSIVIAHRLSTIRDADRIVVLDRGRVVEEGTHAELVLVGGRYADLYADWERAVEPA